MDLEQPVGHDLARARSCLSLENKSLKLSRPKRAKQKMVIISLTPYFRN
jgi:hypothetical protein